MEAYLDNAATTRVSEKVAELAQKLFMTDYGNPSSKHNKGLDAERYIKDITVIRHTLSLSGKWTPRPVSSLM